MFTGYLLSRSGRRRAWPRLGCNFPRESPDDRRKLRVREFGDSRSLEVLARRGDVRLGFANEPLEIGKRPQPNDGGFSLY